ncbi:uncharacterized protein LOC130674740 [Microplitis mediator]|uniref:uncharacterized protein LOC130674740 n=1 Tax=Microplitis mediator TaxID=375433 RepID=UPI0025575073|nr:uncharacterized protein LOC130674740 [Microplitis mediator]
MVDGKVNTEANVEIPVIKAWDKKRSVHCSTTRSMKISSHFILLFIVGIITMVIAMPADGNRIGTCIRNCAQCKKMFGPYFEGQLCADTCVKFKGKMIPDCEDADSIAPFIVPLENE